MISIYDSLITGMKLNNNIFNNIQSFATSLQRMMSGAKINSPKDSPSGFYVASNFTTQIRGLETANKNIQTAVNMLGMADGSIEEINDIMGQIRELVEKSTNEYLTPGEREANQNKINKLFAQAQKIKDDTEFNGNKLFSNSAQLDKNQTYKDDKPVTVTRASNQILNRIGDNPPPSSTSYTTPDEAVSTAATVPVEGAAGEQQSTRSPETAPTKKTRMAAMSATPLPNNGTISFTSTNETKTVTIAGKTYTVTGSYTNVDYSYDRDTGFITFNGDLSAITAADNQADKIILATTQTNVNTGNMDDTIIIKRGSTGVINAGDGNDVIIVEDSGGYQVNGGAGDDQIILKAPSVSVDGGSGNNTVIDFRNDGSSSVTAANKITGSVINLSSSSTVSFAAGETKAFLINDKMYTVKNNSSGSNSLNLNRGAIGRDPNAIGFFGSNFTITAAEGQDDDILVDGAYNYVYTGDGDDIIWTSSGANNYVESGDGNDTIYVGSGVCNSTIDGGLGANNIILENQGCLEDPSNNTIYKGSGTVTNNTGSNSLNNQIYDYKSQNWGTSGSKALKGGETIVAKIGDKTYIFESKYDSTLTATIGYSIGSNNQIILNVDNTIITAVDGQVDNLKIQGQDNEIFAGDMDDTIVVGAAPGKYNSINNIVHGGAGNDNITLNSTTGTVYGDAGNDTITLNTIGSGAHLQGFGGDGNDTFVTDSSLNEKVTIDGGAGTNSVQNTGNNTHGTNIQNVTGDALTIVRPPETTSGTVNISYGNSQTINVGGKLYTIERNGTSGSATLGYALNGGQITFTGDGWKITAADGQVDNLKILGQDNEIFAGDMDDTIVVDMAPGTYNSINNIVHGGAGNDKITIIGTSGIAYGDAGNDIITLENYGSGSHLQGFGGDGNDSFIVTRSSHEAGSDYNDHKVSIDGGAGTNSVQNTGNFTFGTNIQNVNGDSLYGNSSTGSGGSSFGATGTYGFSAGETITAIINGKTYTIKNDSDNAQTFFYDTDTSSSLGTINVSGSDYYKGFTITAADGQNDSIRVSGNNGWTINTGDGDDTIYVHSVGHTVNAGSGNDRIYLEGAYSTNVISGSGNDYIDIDSGSSDNTIADAESNDNIVDRGINTAISTSGSSSGSGSVGEPIIWNTAGGTQTVKSGETIKVAIGDKVYTLYNGGSNNQEIYYSYYPSGQLSLSMDDIQVTAESGQKDNIYLAGNNNKIYSGDEDDTIIFSGNYNYINTGDGDDYVQLSTVGMNLDNTESNNIINTGAGNDTIVVNTSNNSIDAGSGNNNITIGYDDSSGSIGNWSGNTISGSGNNTIHDYYNKTTTGHTGSVDFLAGETKTVTIGDKTYTVTNNESSSTITFIWSIDESGKITMSDSGSTAGFTVRAASGQADDIEISGGYFWDIDTGDGDDTIILDTQRATVNAGSGNDTVTINSGSNNNTVNGGAGTNTLVDNGTNTTATNFGPKTSDSVSFGANETKTIEIDGKIYTVKNNGSANNTFNWEANSSNGIVFMSSNFEITAASGQQDKIIIKGSDNVLNTGDGDDRVDIYDTTSHNNVINTGDGNDEVWVSVGYNNTINTGNGNDSVYLFNEASNNTVNLGLGNNDSINNSGSGTTIKYAFNANETKNLTINGFSYAITNIGSANNEISYTVNSSGAITFAGDKFKVKSDSGQGDNVIWDVNNGELDLSDSAGTSISRGDTVVVNGVGNTVKTGMQGDNITINGANNYVDSTTGNDVIQNNNTSNTVKQAFNTNETKTITVGGKQYTVQNTGSSGNAFEYSVDSSGKTIFKGDNFKITAKDGQSDNIAITGNNNNVNLGDGNDNVTVNSGSTNNTVDGGTGTNTLIDNGTNTTATNFGPKTSDSVSFGTNETKTITIGDKNYTVINKGSANNSFNWNLNSSTGEITFTGSNFDVMASSGQSDKLIINGSSNNIKTGDQNDTVTLGSSSQNNTVNAGLGSSDKIIDNGQKNVVRYDFNSTENKTLTINGKTYDVKNVGAQGNTLSYSIDTAGKINFVGNDFVIKAADGQNDNLGITGNDNTVDAGNGNNNVTIGSGSGNTVNGGNSTTVTDNGSGTTVTKPNEGMYSFGVGESQTIDINGKKYTVVNNGTAGNKLTYAIDTNTGKITFDGSDFDITAASGQKDDIVLNGSKNNVDLGDLDDDVVINGYHNNLDGGSGVNNYIDNGYNNTIKNFVLQDKGSITFNANETQTYNIGGKVYTFTNKSGSTNSFIYSYDRDTGVINFNGQDFDMTAASGQEDNIIWGMHNGAVDLGDGDDFIENNGLNSTIVGGAGYDKIVDNIGANTSGFEEGTVHFRNNDTKEITIDGKKYTVTNNAGSSSTGQTLTYKLNTTTKEITFNGDYFSIVADAGQEDNVILNGNHSSIDTGDLNDKIVIASGSDNTVNTGAGNNNLTVNGDKTTIQGGSGNDNIVINSNYNSIHGGAGNDMIIVNGDYNIGINSGEGNDTVIINGDWNGLSNQGNNGNTNINVSGNNNSINAGSGDDKISISGNNNNSNAGAGDDYTIITGKDNTVNGGTGYDKVSNKGTGNSYTGMNELLDQNVNFNIQVDGNFGENSKYGISTGILLPDMVFDVSSRESAISSLKQLDEVILGLTTSRVDIGFQSNMLESIMKSNLTRLTNLKTSRSTIIDADTAKEYNNLVEKAALIDSGRALQAQAAENQAALLKKLIGSIAS